MIQKKICMLGASGVGKTSLIKQYVEGMFSEKYLTSIGVKIDKKVVETPNQSVQFMIWDIEGIDRYCGFQPKYVRGAAGVIIVADTTRSQSLVEGLEIFKQVQEITDVPCILALNKVDLETKWHWSDEELKTFKQDFSASFATSAKTGQGVEDLFYCMAQTLTE